MPDKLIADGVFASSDPPRLLAGRCLSCATITFPRQGGCPRCAGRDIADHALAAAGTLWAWTVQRFRPKPPYLGPDEFEPFGVGYVEFPGECVVEGRLTTIDPAILRIGAPMEVCTLEVAGAEAGGTLITYAFRPAGARAAAP